MKKQLLAMAGVLLAWNAGAQTQTGNGLLSGSVAVNYYQSEAPQSTYSQSNWLPNLNLTAGRFVANNWLLGLTVSGRSSFGESTVPVLGGLRNVTLRPTNRQISVTTTPFVRRYWRFDPVLVFAGAGVLVDVGGSEQVSQTYNYQTSRVTTASQRTQNLSVNPYLEAGANYFLTKRLALQLTASAGSLPFTVGGFSTGLVYWTGPERPGDPQPERDNPQTNRGNWLVEGGFSVSSTTNRQVNGSTNQSALHTYTVSPAVGYFIGKNNLIGIRIPLAFGRNENTASPQTTNRTDIRSIGIAPYYQHYFSQTRLTPFFALSATYGVLTQTVDEVTLRSVQGSAGIGLAYMAGQRFIVETSLVNAQFSSLRPDESSSANRTWSAGLSAGLSGSFAVRYVLTRAK